MCVQASRQVEPRTQVQVSAHTFHLAETESLAVCHRVQQASWPGLSLPLHPILPQDPWIPDTCFCIMPSVGSGNPNSGPRAAWQTLYPLTELSPHLHFRE